jgi:HK97 family phage major capsid protein
MERLRDLTARMEKSEVARDFANALRLLAKHAGGGRDPEADLRTVPQRVKAAVTAATIGASTWGDDVSWQQLTRDWMSLLSSRTLLGQIPFRKAAFNTRTLVEDVAGTAAWISEGGGIPISALALDTVQLTPAKIAGLVVLTKEVVEVASPAALDSINRAMLNTVGRFSDEAMCNPDISASGTSPASLTSGSTQVASTGNTEAAITANVKSLLQVHADAESDLTEVHLVMHPATALHLSQLSTSGVRAYPNLGVAGGAIFGVKVHTTTGAKCSGSPTEKVIACINAAGVLVADDNNIEISVSDKAAIQMVDSATLTQDAAAGTASDVVSLFMTHSVGIKFIRRLNFVRSHATSVSYMRVNF